MTFDKPFDRITVESDKMSGQPCIRGMRITVRRCLSILATYSDRERLFANYPDLEEEDLTQALAFAAANLKKVQAPLKVAYASFPINVAAARDADSLRE